MTISEHLKFTVRGFSPKRTAYILVFASLALMAICDGTDFGLVGHLTAKFTFGLLSIVLILCLLSPRSIDRWLPFGICLAIFLLSL
jgi:hypothetical protein